MNIAPWRKRIEITPINGELTRLRDEMDRTFERFLTDPFDMTEPKMLRLEGWMPPLDISETDSEVTVRAEIPGMATEDLDISVTDHSLCITGKKEEREEHKGEDFFRCERRFGSFRRVINLPETADADAVVAETNDGVLTIRIAKRPGGKPRHVKIKPTAQRVGDAH